MINIHTYALPEVVDGAQSLEGQRFSVWRTLVAAGAAPQISVRSVLPCPCHELMAAIARELVDLIKCQWQPEDRQPDPRPDQ